MYELKEYLNAINHTKEPIMDTEDEVWEKKYPPFIVNKCIAPFQDTIMLVNEMNRLHHLDKKANKQSNLEYVKEFYGYSNAKAKSALTILTSEQVKEIKTSLNKGGKNGKH